MTKKILLIGLLCAAMLLVGPVSTYSSSNIDRGGQITVSTDENSTLQLTNPNEFYTNNRELTTVTNNFDQMTSVTVTLDPQYQNDARLVAGNQEGNSVTFNLNQSGGSQQVEVLKNNGNGKVKLNEITYTIEFEYMGGISGSFERTATNQGGGGGGGGGPPGQN